MGRSIASVVSQGQKVKEQRDAERSLMVKVLALAAALRVVLLVWGKYQDETQAVKYTDIDYFVFSDAARCLVHPSSTGCSPATGSLAHLLPFPIGDPYSRSTYRYTPLLSILIAPNTVVPIFGKLLFALSDLVLGVLLHRLLLLRGVASRTATKYVAIVWLLNPIIANISTRGSSESLLGLMVVSALYLATKKKWDACAIVFGLAVHFKVFPVIYGSSLIISLKGGRWFVSWERMRFGLVSAASFGLFNVACFAIWGHPFVEHTFLYHISRIDHHHNFSPYFYPMYLSLTSSSSGPPWATAIVRSPLAAFVPQLGLSIGLGFAFGKKDLAFAWFTQTFAFVMLNKVCTSQYFLWYLWLLPPVLAHLDLSRNRGLALIATWVVTQALWLSQAFRLEMQAQPVFREVWAAGVVFLLANCWVLGELVRSYRPQIKVVKLV